MCSFLSRSISSRSPESDNDGLEDNSKYISIIFKTMTNIIYICIYTYTFLLKKITKNDLHLP